MLLFTKFIYIYIYFLGQRFWYSFVLFFLLYNYLRLEWTKSLIFFVQMVYWGHQRHAWLRQACRWAPGKWVSAQVSVSSHELHGCVFMWVYDSQEGLCSQVECGMGSSQRWVALFSDPILQMITHGHCSGGERVWACVWDWGKN